MKAKNILSSFRFYSPTEGYLDRGWVLPDIQNNRRVTAVIPQTPT